MALGESLSRARVDELVRAAARGERWLELDRGRFTTDYNRRPFVVRHRLPTHPRFALDALRALCRRLPREQVRYRVGAIAHDADFDHSLDADRRGLTFDEAIDQLEDRRAYVAIYNPERDPTYRPVIEGLLGELATETELVEPGLNWYSTYVFISTEASVTPYHMDREMNFLLQIRGTKHAELWDPRDDEVMSPAERDRLLAARDEPRPRWGDHLPAKAMAFELVPGTGVHHPFIAPHLVRTTSALSISLAITFRTAQSDRWTAAHRFNHLVRTRLRLAPPVAVGVNPWVDHAKAAMVRGVTRLRAATRPPRAR